MSGSAELQLAFAFWFGIVGRRAEAPYYLDPLLLHEHPKKILALRRSVGFEP